MNLRQFLCSIPAALFSGKALAKSIKPVQLHAPEREFPWWTPKKQVVGLWAQVWDYDKHVWFEPYLILAEFNEDTDNPYEGTYLNNDRRNKFWGQRLNSVLRGEKDRTLLIIERWGTDIRFFRNEPNIDWSLIYPKV